MSGDDQKGVPELGERPRHVIVGRGGSGKSRLLAELADDSATVVWVKGRRLDRATPLDAFDGTPADAARGALVEELDAGARLLVDDAQWLDPESIAVLAGAIDRCPEASFVVATRAHPAPDGLGELLRLGRRVELTDRALDSDELRAHIARLGPEALATLRADAHGLPDAIAARTTGLDAAGRERARAEIRAEGIDAPVARGHVEPPVSDDATALPFLAEAHLRAGRLREAVAIAQPLDDERSGLVVAHAQATAGLRDAATATLPFAAETAPSRVLRGEFDPALDAAEPVAAVLASPAPAVAALTDAARAVELTGTDDLSPDPPHLLGAVTAAAAGRGDAARDLVDDYLASELGSTPTRLQAERWRRWFAMRTGDLAATNDEGSTADTSPARLLDAAIDAGTARRRGDVAATLTAWAEGQRALRSGPVDLLQTELVGEVLLAGARAPSFEATPARAEIERLLETLDHPPIWTAAWAWADLQLAITDDAPAAVGNAAAKLETLAVVDGDDYFRALSAAAAAWAAAMNEAVSLDDVREACEGLRRVGMVWEAAQLAGGAAVRTGDKAQARLLLDLARDLRSELPTLDPADTADSPLTDREREIAAGVVDGLTHREIGEVLFISPKTVEHGVARIRQKLGVSTRAEMMATLREMFAD